MLSGSSRKGQREPKGSAAQKAELGEASFECFAPVNGEFFSTHCKLAKKAKDAHEKYCVGIHEER